MKAPAAAPVLAVDFDGVIHAASHGWADGSVYDPPVPGAIEALWSLMEKYEVIILTARPNLDDVVTWLKAHDGPEGVVDIRNAPCPQPPAGNFWGRPGTVLVTNHKYGAVAYVDDNAIRFTSWPQAMEALLICPECGRPVINGQHVCKPRRG